MDRGSGRGGDRGRGRGGDRGRGQDSGRGRGGDRGRGQDSGRGGGGQDGGRGGDPRGGGGGGTWQGAARGYRGGTETGGGGGGYTRGGGGRGGRGGDGYTGGGRGGGAPKQDAIVFRPKEGGLEKPSADVAKAEDASVGLSLSALSIKGEKTLPVRPSYGTTGTPIVLRTNYFQITLPNPKLTLFRYVVEFQPDPKGKSKRMMQLLIDRAPFLAKAIGADNIATDYKTILITSVELNLGPDGFQEGSVPFIEPEEREPGLKSPTFKMRVKRDGVVSVANLLQYLMSTDPKTTCDDKGPILQALNIVMSRLPSNTTGIAAFRGGKFFPVDKDPTSLGGGLTALRGIYTSVRTSTLRLLLNVNSITAAFYESGPLTRLMDNFLSTVRSGIYQEQMKELQKFLFGIRVELKHIKSRTKDGVYKKKVICGLITSPKPVGLGAHARQATFEWEKDGKRKRVTVEAYYREAYGIALKEGQRPLVNVGNKEHPIMIPPELCSVVPGQISGKKLSGNQTASMVNVACRQPATNAELIVGEGANILGLGQDRKDGPRNFGLEIKPQMIAVSGRILRPPTLVYANPKQTTNPRFGSWNMQGIKFSVGAKITNWSVMEIQWNGRRVLSCSTKELTDEFGRQMGLCGLHVEPIINLPHTVLNLNPADPDSHDTAIDGFLKMVRQAKVRMILVVIPEKDTRLYPKIKFRTDVTHGLHCVCVAANTVNKQWSGRSGPAQYLANVALKFNLKRGGTNQQLPKDKMGILDDGNTMLMGIDVTHPSPDSQTGAPSIAACVASIDKRCGQWPASIRAQESKKEMVSDLDDLIVERLRSWQNNNKGALPNKILVYRDGVSEGQYLKVLNEESPLFDKAINRIYKANEKKPLVTIIIVGKRHHTRFYPTDENGMARSGNPHPGTIVDRGVTMERGWDFFLQAHDGLKGTARPAHYVVIQNQIGIKVDALEQLTHNLCYLFGRATKSVSICPPAYYADILAERARCYLDSTFNSGRSDMSFDWAGARWTRDVHEDIKNSMFYI